MIQISSYDKNIESTFKEFMQSTGLDKDSTFYRKILAVENDVKFFNEFIARMPAHSGFQFDVKISLKGLIHNGFINKINNFFNYYDYKILHQHLYIFEILKRLFANNWIENVGVNLDTVKQVVAFHKVVTYYLEIKEIEDYVSDFIGSSYGINLFMNEVNKCLIGSATVTVI